MRVALEVAEMGEWDMDVVTKSLHRTERTARIFGNSEAGRKWTLESFLTYVVPEDRAIVTGSLNEAFRTRQPWEFECRILRTDGVQRWIRVKGRLECDAAGKAGQFRGLIHDITNRKGAEEALREIRDRERARSAELERLLDAVPAAVWISQDPRGDCITGNRLSYDWLRIPLGSNASKSAPEGERPETFALFKDGVELPVDHMPVRVSAAGREVRDYEFDIVYPDGTVRHVFGNAVPLFDGEGKPRGSVSAFIDVSRRKRAERDLRRTRDYLEALFNYANAPIIVWDPQFMITGFNKAFELLTGRKAEEVIGKSLDILFPEDMCEQAHALLRRTQEGERWETVEIPIVRVDGSVRTVIWNSAALYGEDELTVTATVAQGQDVTERKQAETEREDYLEGLKFIADTATAFLRKQTSAEVFEYCAQKIGELVHDGLVVVTEYDIVERCRIVRAVCGDHDALRKISATLGKELPGMRLPFDARTREKMVPGNLIRIKGGLHNFSSEELPESHCRQIEGQLGLSDIHAIPFAWEDEFLGTVVILTGAELLAKNARVIETFVSQAAIALKRIRSEESLVQGERDFRVLMEEASDGIVLVDPEGRIVAVNTKACELYGYTRPELLSRLVADLVLPEDIPLLIGSLREIDAGRSAIVEHRLIRKDGARVFVETSARKLADGRYQAIIRDISDRKRAEEEFTQAVQTEVFDRLISSLRQFYHGAGLAMNLHRLALFGKNYQALVSEHSRNSNGSGSPLDAYAHSRLEIAVKEYFTVGYPRLREIASLLRAVQEEINHKSTAGEEPVFATDISSRSDLLRADLEQLLHVARGEAGGEPADCGGVGERVADHAQHILHSVGVLAGKLNAHFTSNLSEVVRAVMSTIQSSSPGTAMEIRADAPEIAAIISPADLGEVLSILLTNSLEALAGKTPGEGKVTVRLGTMGNRARIEVEDNGEGVKAEILARGFGSGETSKGAGRGFGLGYARKHLRKYNGTLTHDERFSAGARFVVELVLA